MPLFLERVLPVLKRVWTLIYDFVDITDRRHIFLLSSGIAFNLFLCIIPLVVLIVSLVSGVMDVAHTKKRSNQLWRSFFLKTPKPQL